MSGYKTVRVCEFCHNPPPSCHHLHPLEEQAVNLRHHPPAAVEVNVTAKLVFDFNLLFTLLDEASFITAGEMADLFLLRKS